MLNPIDRGCTGTETVFNFLGGIPIVGVVSGAVRVVAGKIQLVAATLFATISVVASVVCTRREDALRWNGRLDHAVDHMCQGVLNITRGTIEAAFGATMIGSILLFMAQKNSENGFAPLIKYNSSLQSRGVKLA